ncbi:hypothetical protein DL96DRAFT_1745899 [Flagelloscypha sp. PMI_526]|nr:hypothetical protein DL96DRAFT_1745899 [Flagelloscypha sp. PMI_526]
MSSALSNLSLTVPRPSSGQNPKSTVPSSLPSNYLVIHVDRFGFSANNITYQALGENPHFRYFDFHAAPEDTSAAISPKTHGLFPVWGFGTVVKSTHNKIQSGERVYGYFAPVKYLVVSISEADVNTHAFYVPRPHLPADRRPYNQIIRCSTDPQYSPTAEDEDLTMLYRPLFWTSYWFEDWVFSTNYRGADTVLLSSASSKTAFCAAYLVKKRRGNGQLPSSVQIVGLTSKRNVEFTKKLGLYDVVLEYDGFESTAALKKGKSKIYYADVAGSDELNRRIFAHFSATGQLVAAIQLGMTNLSPQSSAGSTNQWTTNNFSSTSSPAAVTKMEQFFMVEWLNIRKNQLKPGEIFQRQLDAWRALMKDGRDWVTIQRVYGAERVKSLYQDVAQNGLGPDKGFVWSMWEDDGRGAKL